MAKITDERLIAAFGAGDAGAMDELLSRYQDRVFQFVLWKTGLARAEAEDLAQEVFLQVFRSIESFTGRSRFRTWLYAVAGHVCNRALRSRSRKQRFEAVDSASEKSDVVQEIPDDRPGVLDLLQAKERDLAVHAAVMELENKHRVALLLRDWEDLSYSEMAEVLKIPAGTVKSRVHNARLQLGRILSPIMEGEVGA